MLRQKAFSFINIAGLAIGMASAILILMWVQSELDYDNFYPKGDRLYMMYNRDKFDGELHSWNSTPKIMAEALRKDYPEVEDAARVNSIVFLLTSGEKHLNLRGIFTDEGFLNMFSFPLESGNEKTALKGANNIVITKKLVVKLFGNENAMGKTIRVDSNANFTVTGVLKDLPANTDFNFEYMLPWAYMKKLGWDDSEWGNNTVKTYALLKQGASQAAFDEKVKNIKISHSKETAQVFTHPVSRLHLYSKDENGKLVGGQIIAVRLFILIALFILLIACVNFMNLSTARSEKRAKEVGIRKVSGAVKSNLIAQFIGESIMFSIIAFVVALLLVFVSLQSFNQLTGKQLTIDYHNLTFWLFSIGFILFTGIVAGSYPAFYLSSFQPVKVLKGTFKKVNAAVTPRKVLVVMQFTFAIVLIICTIIVKNQIQYAQNRDAGYNQENLIYAFVQGDADKNYKLIKQDLVSSGTALSVTRSENPITQRWGDNWGYSWQGSTQADERIDFVRLGADADLIKTIGLKLAQGRDIDIYNYPTDSTAVMLNETAVKAMHLKNPIGMTLRNKYYANRSYHVVGVVKDFIMESPFESKLNPMIITGPNRFFQVIHIKFNPVNGTANNIAKAEQIFKKYNPEYPFDYAFANESYANKFKEQQRVGVLAALFAGLTIFISCMGLFGLASYMAQNRIKEIGVRKVLGASVVGVATLLSKDFLKLVIISFFIASPIAWWAMDKWLQSYTYRITISVWVFIITAILTLVIAIITVSSQAIKAAIANPVKSLRSE